jgi:hypothetical protein
MLNLIGALFSEGDINILVNHGPDSGLSIMIPAGGPGSGGTGTGGTTPTLVMLPATYLEGEY